MLPHLARQLSGTCTKQSSAALSAGTRNWPHPITVVLTEPEKPLVEHAHGSNALLGLGATFVVSMIVVLIKS